MPKFEESITIASSAGIRGDISRDESFLSLDESFLSLDVPTLLLEVCFG